MEWLAALFIVTGMWVWFWAAVCFILVLAFSENEQNLFAFITVGAFIALMHHSAVFSIFMNPLTILMWAAIYFAAGGAWSFVKWFSYVTKRAEEFGEWKVKWIESFNKNKDVDERMEVNIKTRIPTKEIPNFNRYLESKYYTYKAKHQNKDNDTLDSVMPSAMENKERIVTWILWWPTSAFWTLLNDPLVRFANWMYSRFQGMYKRIAYRAFAKFEV